MTRQIELLRNGEHDPADHPRAPHRAKLAGNRSVRRHAPERNPGDDRVDLFSRGEAFRLLYAAVFVVHNRFLRGTARNPGIGDYRTTTGYTRRSYARLCDRRTKL